MMGNAQIPRRADEIETEHGFDADGLRVEACVFKHTRRGHHSPMFWIVLYRRTGDGRIDKSTRITRQYEGLTAQQRMRKDFAEARDLLVDTRS
jgi:hypothetical protein